MRSMAGLRKGQFVKNKMCSGIPEAINAC
jgi:hypothetical protein